METLQVDIIDPKATKLLSDLAELNLIKIKEILKKPKVNPEVYPFRPQFLKHDGISYVLKEKIEGIVSFEENQYIISNEQLGITIWGDTRDKAEDAFAFAFHALYNDYAKEDDKMLTAQARKLKRTLLKLIVNVEGNYED